MDTTQVIRSYLAVVETGSFIGAARSLGITRSAVTKQIAQLEDALGTQLLIRSTRSVTRTAAGERFFDASKPLLEQFDELIDTTRSDQGAIRGNLRVNAPMSFGTLYLAPIISAFMAAHPDVHVELVMNDRFVDPVEEGFDLTLRVAASEHFTSLETEIIAPIPRFLCASPDYQAPATPEDLRTLRCLHYGYQQSGSQWPLMRNGGQRGYAVNCVMWSNNGDVLKSAAVAGQGVALLPTFLIAAELQQGLLVRVLPEFSATPLCLQMHYPRHQYLSSRTRLLADFIRSRIGNPPQWALVS